MLSAYLLGFPAQGMAVITMQPNLGKLVSKQQLFDALQPISAPSQARSTVATTGNGGLMSCSCPPGNAGGSGKDEERSVYAGGNCTMEGVSQKERQELLWQDFFLDQAQWWDNRHEKKSSRHPDFRHKRTKEPLWLDNRYKPAWVDSQLAIWDAQQAASKGGSTGSESTSSSRNDSESCKVALYEGHPRVRSWSKLCEEGHLTEAVEALDVMVQQGYCVHNALFYRVLKMSVAKKNLGLGRRVHALSIKGGHESNAFLANHIICMYAFHGKLEEASQVFTRVAAPNVFMWSSIIKAYAEHEQPVQAIALYRQMRETSVKPDNHVFVAVLKACATAADLDSGKEIHADILGSTIEPDLFVGNCMVNMYAKCGSLMAARKVFDDLPFRDIVTWTTMIAAFAQNGRGQEALTLYATMQEHGMTPSNPVSFISLLQACASIGALTQGKQLHVQIQNRGLEADLFVGNCLVDMYSKCGSLEDAQSVFDKMPKRDVVTWTAIIAGYTQHGLGQQALSLYARMQQEGITPADRVTYVCLLQACASVGALQEGKNIHSQIQERGLEDGALVGNCLVDMYAKCGSLEDARRVFERLPKRDVTTWNAMIGGYMQQGFSQEALNLYTSMQQDSTAEADHVTFVSLLQACASAAALHQGKEIHSQIQERGLEVNVAVGNCLVDMYAKCGALDDARDVFDKLGSTRDVVTWTALLNGYAQHSDCKMAMQCLDEMLQQGVKPNDATFTCLLIACSHKGLVNEGQQYFKMMVEEFGITPTAQHYNCMIDLLGRSGHIDEAESMLHAMPFEKAVVGWTSLLSACKSHGDVECGRRCFDHLITWEPENSAAYVLLSNIYSNAGRWREADEIESLRKSAGAWKKAAKACIEVKNRVHEFTVGEEKADISQKMRSISSRLKREGGHVPQTELVLKGVSDSEKEDALCGHAEKLALAYGLMNTPDGTTLLVTKNLRMCNDCHSSTKIMSHLERRQIIVRDAHRVHCFQDGCCSCGERH